MVEEEFVQECVGSERDRIDEVGESNSALVTLSNSDCSGPAILLGSASKSTDNALVVVGEGDACHNGYRV